MTTVVFYWKRNQEWWALIISMPTTSMWVLCLTALDGRILLSLNPFCQLLKNIRGEEKWCLVCGFIFVCRDGRKRTCTFQPKVGKCTYNGCRDKHTCICVSVCVLCDILSHCDRSYEQDYGRLLAHGVGAQAMHHCHADQVCGGRKGEWTYGGKILGLNSW